MDGRFLARSELSDAGDVHIFLRTRPETARARGVSRDRAAGGPSSLLENVYDQRYLPAFDLYLAKANPEARAAIVIDLEHFSAPRIVRMPGGHA